MQMTLLIVCDAEESQVKYLRAILILFEVISGLHDNRRKSHIVPVNEVPNIQIMTDILEGASDNLPTSYLCHFEPKANP